MAGSAIEEMPLYAMFVQHPEATEEQLDLVYEVLAQFVLYGETVEDMARILEESGGHIESHTLKPTLLRMSDDIHLLTRQEFPGEVRDFLYQRPLRETLNSFDTDIDWLYHKTVAIHAATNAFLSRRVAGGWIRTGRVAREVAECREALSNGLRILDDYLTRAMDLTAALVSTGDASASDYGDADYSAGSVFDDQSVFDDSEDESIFDGQPVFDDSEVHHTNEFLVIQNPGVEPSVLATKI